MVDFRDITRQFLHGEVSEDIEEGEARLLSESPPMMFDSLATKEFAQAVKGETAINEAYEYNPVDEIYTMLDHLQKAQMIAEEIVKYSERDPAYEEFGDPFFSFSNQLKKLMAPVGSQADKAYKMGNTAQPAYRDDLDPGDII